MHSIDFSIDYFEFFYERLQSDLWNCEFEINKALAFRSSSVKQIMLINIPNE